MFAVLILVIVSCGAYGNEISLVGYYWREFDGFLPDDAIVAGYDRRGDDTYLGQAFLTTGAVVPVSLKNDGNPTVNAAYSIAQNTSVYNQVLCSQNPSYLQWIPVTSKTAKLLTGYPFVIGGADHKNTFKIGRVKYQNELMVGRVACDSKEATLYIAHKDGEYPAKTFEILVYSNETVSIDYPEMMECNQ